MIKIGAILLSVIAVLAVLVMAWHGMFSRLSVSAIEDGPYTIAYEEFIGPYQKTGPVFERVNKDIAAAGVKATLGIGIYLDDPSKVPAEKLRSKCGVVVDPHDAQVLKALAPRILVDSIPKGRSLAVILPIRSPLSYMLGPIKAYPALGKCAAAQGLPVGLVYELYDMPARTILYVMRIAP